MHDRPFKVRPIFSMDNIPLVSPLQGPCKDKAVGSNLHAGKVSYGIDRSLSFIEVGGGVRPIEIHVINYK